MERQVLLKKTLRNLTHLPDWRLQEVSDYIDFLLQKNQDKILLEGIKEMASNSKSFHFLEEDEELYSDSDLIEKYK